MSAFTRAVEVGADGIEFDVQAASDGQLVVMHDVTIDRTTSASGPVVATTAAVLRAADAGGWYHPAYAGERVPLLDEVLALPLSRFELELKGFTADFVGDVLDSVGRPAPSTAWSSPPRIRSSSRRSGATEVRPVSACSPRQSLTGCPRRYTGRGEGDRRPARCAGDSLPPIGSMSGSSPTSPHGAANSTRPTSRTRISGASRRSTSPSCRPTTPAWPDRSCPRTPRDACPSRDRGSVMSAVVEVLELGEVRLPDWHPRSHDGTALVRAFAIRHHDGVILFDTGVGHGHPLIDELYEQPQITPIVEALNRVGIDERDVRAIVNSHLHFDHCGQNQALPSVPVHVQSAELAAARLPHYTIPEWARIAPERRRVIDGDEDIAPGVRILSTPGHTPGHQSLLVRNGGGQSELIAGQCCYTCAEFREGVIEADNIHDENHRAMAVESLDRLRSLDLAAVHLSHDRTIHRP